MLKKELMVMVAVPKAIFIVSLHKMLRMLHQYSYSIISHNIVYSTQVNIVFYTISLVLLFRNIVEIVPILSKTKWWLVLLCPTKKRLY